MSTTVEQARAAQQRLKSQHQKAISGRGIGLEKVGEGWGIVIRFPSEAVARAANVPSEFEGVPVRTDIIPDPFQPRPARGPARKKKTVRK